MDPRTTRIATYTSRDVRAESLLVPPRAAAHTATGRARTPSSAPAVGTRIARAVAARSSGEVAEGAQPRARRRRAIPRTGRERYVRSRGASPARCSAARPALSLGLTPDGRRASALLASARSSSGALAATASPRTRGAAPHAFTPAGIASCATTTYQYDLLAPRRPRAASARRLLRAAPDVRGKLAAARHGKGTRSSTPAASPSSPLADPARRYGGVAPYRRTWPRPTPSSARRCRQYCVTLRRGGGPTVSLNDLGPLKGAHAGGRYLPRRGTMTFADGATLVAEFTDGRADQHGQRGREHGRRPDG